MPEQFEGSEKLELEIKLRSHTIDFTGQSYLVGFVLPNLYFHVATGYNILRHNGLELSKPNFLGQM